MKTIISASRRTDIPHYFAQWFSNRRKAGHVEFRNAFGGKGSVSLKPADVAGYLFWTKYAKPFHDELKALRDEGMPYAFQYTITGLGTHSIEPHIPRTEAAIDDFLRVRNGLPSSTSIQWRYDPLVISDDMDEAFHVETFLMIAKPLQGATCVVNTSFTEPYAKSIRRMKDQGRFTYRTMDPARHKQASKRHPDIGQISTQRATNLLKELSAIGADHGMQPRVFQSRIRSAQIAMRQHRDIFWIWRCGRGRQARSVTTGVPMSEERRYRDGQYLHWRLHILLCRDVSENRVAEFRQSRSESHHDALDCRMIF